jgi:hypothetical protein
MKELPLLRFIPFRRDDIFRMCLADLHLDDWKRKQLQQAREVIDPFFQKDFHSIRQQLKDAYSPLDPDADTRLLKEFIEPGTSAVLTQLLEQVLDRANYERVSDATLQRAFASASLFSVQLYVDMNDFEEALLYVRGATQRHEEVRKLFGLWRKKVEFTNLERVVLYIRFREDVDADSTLGGCRPGTTMLKLFQNVPAADIEMLFPNTRVGMRLMDKLLIGVPALVSGGVVISTKLGATLVLVGSLIGFWLGMKSEPVSLDRTAAIALAAGVGTLGGFLWRQLSKFRHRKLRYTQALTENLYFKLLDNNAGVIYRILDEAEESESKESLLAYYFLLLHDSPVSATTLDDAIEAWFAERWQCRLNFEITDALQKLQQLGLAKTCDGRWEPVSPGS